MSSNDIHGIEPGWSVKTIDGEDIGSVEETTDRYILVKSGLINADHRYFPAARLEHVRPEMKEISLDLTKDAVEAADWSSEPTEPPRRDGAPLNESEVVEVDPRSRVVHDPERPATL